MPISLSLIARAKFLEFLGLNTAGIGDSCAVAIINTTT